MFKNNKHAKKNPKTKQGTMSKSLQKNPDAVNTPRYALKCFEGPRSSHKNATGWFTFLKGAQQYLASIRL